MATVPKNYNEQNYQNTLKEDLSKIQFSFSNSQPLFYPFPLSPMTQTLISHLTADYVGQTITLK
jgi:hypothetical protein